MGFLTDLRLHIDKQTKPDYTKPKSLVSGISVTCYWGQMLYTASVMLCITDVYLCYTSSRDHQQQTTKANPQAGEMAQGLTVYENWHSEFKDWHPCNKPIIPARKEAETGEWLGLAGFQPSPDNTSPRFREIPLPQPDRRWERRTPGTLFRPPCKHTGMDSPLPHLINVYIYSHRYKHTWIN